MNKTSGGEGIQAALFQILKDDAVKVLHSTCQQIWKTQQWPQDWKRSVSFQSQRQCWRMLKLPHIALISHACKVMLKILQVRLQQYMNHELPDVQAGFRKGRGTSTRTVLTNHCSVPTSRNSPCDKKASGWF